MRRVGLYLFTLVSALALLFSVYSALLEVYGEGGYGAYFQPLGPERRFTGSETNLYPLAPPPPEFALLGFEVRRTIRVAYTVQDGRLFVVPYWFLSLVWAMAPALWARRAMRRARERRAARRVEAGHCPTCDYDLRGSPGRCPECGALPGKAGTSCAI